MGERFLIWKWLYCQISWSEHSNSRFSSGTFWLTICPLDHSSWRLYWILRKISYGQDDLSWWPFDEAIHFSTLIFLHICVCGMWAGDVGYSCGRRSRKSGEDWERLGQCPKLPRQDCSVIDTVFPSLFRWKLDHILGRDSWHHVDPQNREMECELCLTCVLTVWEVSCESYD
jgi:hypothetical protein